MKNIRAVVTLVDPLQVMQTVAARAENLAHSWADPLPALWAVCHGKGSAAQVPTCLIGSKDLSSTAARRLYLVTNLATDKM